ncbi:hypothetical protein DL765_001433 [Monosporascus sp. GIB2]|nr:hypothetical protein DL765_001433 [Monosporascus sp. GIB2]
MENYELGLMDGKGFRAERVRGFSETIKAAPARSAHYRAVPATSAFPITKRDGRRDLRDLPAGVYLVHSTNCLGVWDAGVAQEIRDVFPAVYGRYEGFCDDFEREPGAAHVSRRLAGRCLIIPPQRGDVDSGSPAISIVCLFASYGYGRKTATKPAGIRSGSSRNRLPEH